jgi:hypothetical protein
MKILASLFFMFFVSLSFGQQKITFSVLDSTTLKPIESASVLIYNTFCCSSNNLGMVELETTQLKVGDIVKVSKLGYQEVFFKYIDLRSLPQKVFLKLKVITLDEVKVNNGKVEQFKLGNPVWLTVNNFLLNFNDQVATYIPGDRFGYVKEVRFNISNDLKGISKPFKMRIFSKGADGIPETNLLPEDIIVYNPKGKSWIGVDVSAYKIALPTNGMFVIFQLLPKEYYDGKEVKLHGRYYDRLPSPALRASKENEKYYILTQHIKSSRWSLSKGYVINLEVLMETE